MCGAILPLPQYVFMAWCVVKHRDNFTFYPGYEPSREIRRCNGEETEVVVTLFKVAKVTSALYVLTALTRCMRCEKRWSFVSNYLVTEKNSVIKVFKSHYGWRSVSQSVRRGLGSLWDP
jgi:hypothetical protein